MRRPAARRAWLVGCIALAGCLAARPPPPPPPLRVGVPEDYAPFASRQDGTLVGLDVDVARRFAADAGRTLELVPFRWPDLTRDLVAGRFDVAMGGVTMRPERALVGTFTRPVLQTQAIVVARAGVGDVDRPSVQLAVNAGGHLERVARRRFPHATLRTTSNDALAGLLASGAVDAVVTDDVEASRLERARPRTHRLGPFSRDRKAYLARDPALADALDAWIGTRDTDGTLDELRARWLDGRRLGQSAFDSDLRALIALVDLRLSLMPAVAAAKERAGRPVEDLAQEARVVVAARARGATLGLHVDRVTSLVRAQIAAARVLQDTWLATPAGEREPVEGAPDLDADLRPALERIGSRVLARMADVARDPDALRRLDPATLAGDIDDRVPHWLRMAIASAIVEFAD